MSTKSKLVSAVAARATWGPVSGISEVGISRPVGNYLGSCLSPSPAVSCAGSIASLISNCRNLSRQQNFSEVMTAQGMEFIMEAMKQLYLQHIFVLP